MHQDVAHNAQCAQVAQDAEIVGDMGECVGRDVGWATAVQAMGVEAVVAVVAVGEEVWDVEIWDVAAPLMKLAEPVADADATIDADN